MSLEQVINGPVINKTLRVIEGIASWMGTVFKSSAQDYVEPVMSDGDDILIGEDFSMVSALRLGGVLSVVGGEEYQDLVNKVTAALSSIMRTPGVVLELTFIRDPERAEQMLRNAVEPSAHTARVLHLNAEDLLESRVSYLSRFVAHEECYLGIWSGPQSLSPAETKSDMAQIKERSKKIPLTGRDRQAINMCMPSLRERHISIVESIEQGLQAADVLVERMDVRQMLRVARRSVCPEWTPDDWNPCLPGDPIPVVDRPNEEVQRRQADVSDLFYPSLSGQIIAREAFRSGKFVEIGDNVYSSVAMEIPPRTIYPFSKLFSRLRDGNIPYRITFRLQSNAMEFTRMKRMFASILAFAGHINRKIRDTQEALAEISDEESVIRYTITMTTWAPAHDIALLQSRRNRMVQDMQAWGDMEVRETVGDPMEMFMDGVPFVRRMPVSNFGYAPLRDVVMQLPIMRPSSPWKDGPVLYRSVDGKLLPFAPGSSLQSTWAYLVMAMPGSGKSVLLANMLLGSALSGGQQHLPCISIVDIGFSSSGLINMMRDMLPQNKQQLVTHFRMQMTRSYCINILDTAVTCRYPTPEHKTTIVNFLTLLATPPENDKPYPSMSQMASKIVDELYKMTADTSTGFPKLYEPMRNEKVDECLRKIGFESMQETTWWEVVDALFNSGHIHEATLAQRYAVPVLADAVKAAQTAAITDLYKVRLSDTQEMLYEAFSRLVSDAIRDYCVLAEPTRFDIGDVRIAAIDIEPVAKQGGAAANKQTALMYMLAKHVLTKNYRLTPEGIGSVCPPHSLQYHLENCKRTRSIMKWIVLDEFHRTGHAQSVREEIEVDIREGRKWGTGIILASQRAADFSEGITEMTTGRFILRASDAKNAKMLQERFGLGDSATEMLLRYGHNPSELGAPFLAQLITSKGTFVQMMYLTLAPLEAWAMNTTATDVVLRDNLSGLLGMREARARLAREFPFSAKAEMERINATYSKNIDVGSHEAFDAQQILVERIMKTAPVYRDTSKEERGMQDLLKNSP